MYKFIFYVPASHLELVKASVFSAGAGRIGHYDCCCWQVEGSGQFRALLGAQAFLGEIGVLEAVTEYRVEMVCKKSAMTAVVEALKKAHPYEEPAYEVSLLLNF